MIKLVDDDESFARLFLNIKAHHTYVHLFTKATQCVFVLVYESKRVEPIELKLVGKLPIGFGQMIELSYKGKSKIETASIQNFSPV